MTPKEFYYNEQNYNKKVSSTTWEEFFCEEYTVDIYDVLDLIQSTYQYIKNHSRIKKSNFQLIKYMINNHLRKGCGTEAAKIYGVNKSRPRQLIYEKFLLYCIARAHCNNVHIEESDIVEVIKNTTYDIIIDD